MKGPVDDILKKFEFIKLWVMEGVPWIWFSKSMGMPTSALKKENY